MATCGYICPACEGRGFDDEGKPCEWCSATSSIIPSNDSPQISDEDWVKRVHEGNCCAGED